MNARQRQQRKHWRLGLLGAAGLGLLAWFFGGKNAPASQGDEADSGRNVIMITWDGVRIDELMGHADKTLLPGAPEQLLPYFRQVLPGKGLVYGDPAQNSLMTIANLSFISLPAYQSIFAGSTQLCESNDCPQQATRTFPERLRASLALPKDQVASFASWEGLRLAVESQPGTTTVNAGLVPQKDGVDAEEAELNKQQVADRPPWDDARYDRYTWRHAMRYLDHHHPRFMYISLDDSDGWGHRVEYRRYVESLQTYDQWLQELVAKLETMGAYGRNTCLIVTTDHGRGSGQHWYTHSNGELASGRIAMYIGCPLAETPPHFASSDQLSTHLDIRPTVEHLFGLAPHECLLCGRSLLQLPSSLSH